MKYLDYGRQFAGIYDALFPQAHVTPDQVEWLSSLLPDRDPLLIVELGVGTGRVALPLAAALAERRPSFIGVDVSQEMLDVLGQSDVFGAISPKLADATQVVPASHADLVLCVCGTLSMITDPVGQEAAVRNAAAALRPGGLLVVETHSPDLVRSMHVEGHATLAVPYEGYRKVLVSFCELDFPNWKVDHCWIDGDRATFASEVSRLTSLSEIDGYASGAGLELVGHFSGLGGAPLAAHSPTVTGLYRRPA